MIQWDVVAAFIGPLIAAIIGVAGFFAYQAKKRDQRVADQIKAVTERLDFRISQVETTLANQSIHLDKQDQALTQAMTAIARIEGRLAGPVSVTSQT